jgi:hypothetical protein
MKVTSRYTIAVCAIVTFASATSAGATTIGVSSFSRQFVGVDLAKATILSDADSADVNTSVAFIERIDLTAPGIGFTTTPPAGPLETTSQSTSQFLQSTGARVAINANFFSDVAATPSPEDLIGWRSPTGQSWRLRPLARMTPQPRSSLPRATRRPSLPPARPRSI